MDLISPERPPVPSDLKIVTARASDAQSIDRLLRELARYEGSVGELSYELPHLVQALKTRRLHALVARSGDDVLGCLTFTWDYAIWSGCTVMRIDDLFVLETARGQGLGTRLMRAAAQLAVAEGALARWEVEPANVNAQRFYKGLGVHLREKIVARWRTAEMMSLVNGVEGDAEEAGSSRPVGGGEASEAHRRE